MVKLSKGVCTLGLKTQKRLQDFHLAWLGWTGKYSWLYQEIDGARMGEIHSNLHLDFISGDTWGL